MGKRWKTRFREAGFTQSGIFTINEKTPFEDVFGRKAGLFVEIGFGKGEFLINMARNYPEQDFIGIEYRTDRLKWVEYKLFRAGLGNVRLIGGDAFVVLPLFFPVASVEACYLNFPDPWPKKRHAKRRLLQAPLIAQLARILRPGGRLVIVSDVESYALSGLEILESMPEAFVNIEGPGRIVSSLEGYYQTIHERKFRRAGRRISFLNFRKL